MDQNQRYSLAEFGMPNSECDLIESMGVLAFQGLFNMTNRNPCDGCAFNSNCGFLKRKKAEKKQKRADNSGKVSFETNAQIAKKLNISKRQASKMKKRSPKIIGDYFEERGDQITEDSIDYHNNSTIRE